MKNKNIIRNTGGALLLGALIGGTLGILFAPDHGKKTRKKILAQSNSVKDILKVKLHCMLEEIQNGMESFTEKANAFTEKVNNFMEIESILNEKILETTLKIHSQYPELVKYLDEMAVTIPDKSNPEITLRNLRAYNNSLNTMLNKYQAEHPCDTATL